MLLFLLLLLVLYYERVSSSKRSYNLQPSSRRLLLISLFFCFIRSTVNKLPDFLFDKINTLQLNVDEGIIGILIIY